MTHPDHDDRKSATANNPEPVNADVTQTDNSVSTSQPPHVKGEKRPSSDGDIIADLGDELGGPA